MLTPHVRFEGEMEEERGRGIEEGREGEKEYSQYCIRGRVFVSGKLLSCLNHTVNAPLVSL